MDQQHLSTATPLCPEQVTELGSFHNDPFEVVLDPAMSKDQKRALLASWASDARAVTNAPALRRLDNGAMVGIDDILTALKRLDGFVEELFPEPRPLVGPRSLRRRRLQGNARRLHRRAWRRGPDDEDDPPPFAAAALPHRPLPILDGARAVAAT